MQIEDCTYPARTHSLLVRLTHWVSAVSVAALAVSGVAILLAHPRLYWGETGASGAPSLVDLPLPFVLTGQSGWGRSLHFLAAWVCVLTGTLYAVSGIVTDHLRRDVLPRRADRSLRSIARSLSAHLRFDAATRADVTTYNALQRWTYTLILAVVFPLIVWTGLAMSPAVTSVWPLLATGLGGHQSARTLHFVLAVAVLVFAVVHVGMVCVSGFAIRMRAMTIGGSGKRRGEPWPARPTRT